MWSDTNWCHFRCCEIIREWRAGSRSFPISFFKLELELELELLPLRISLFTPSATDIFFCDRFLGELSTFVYIGLPFSRSTRVVCNHFSSLQLRRLMKANMFFNLLVVFSISSLVLADRCGLNSECTTIDFPLTSKFPSCGFCCKEGGTIFPPGQVSDPSCDGVAAMASDCSCSTGYGY